MTNHYQYPGKELHLFQDAGKWKQYMARKLKPYISGHVLEVGAGIGDTSTYLLNEKIKHWIFLEPDKKLFQQLQERLHEEQFPVQHKTVNGSLSELQGSVLFDTILYIDVLEHIEDDKSQLSKSVSYLKKGGHLIVLAPAHQALYGPFDKAIGHYRRYSKRSLRRVADIPTLAQEKIFFLDSAAVLLLWLNKYVVKKKYPTKREIWIWQNLFLPVSKLLDKILFYNLGKSIIGIWRKS